MTMQYKVLVNIPILMQDFLLLSILKADYLILFLLLLITLLISFALLFSLKEFQLLAVQMIISQLFYQLNLYYLIKYHPQVQCGLFFMRNYGLKQVSIIKILMLGLMMGTRPIHMIFWVERQEKSLKWMIPELVFIVKSLQ